jgi:hypothetical protein
MTRSLGLALVLLISRVAMVAAGPIEVVNESSAAFVPDSLTAEIRVMGHGPQLLLSGRGAGTTRQLEIVILDAAGTPLWVMTAELLRTLDARVSVRPAGVVHGERIARVVIRDQTPETIAARERIMPEVLRRISAEEAATESEAARRREAERQARAAAVKVGPDPESFRGIPWRASEDETKKIYAAKGEYLSCAGTSSRACWESNASIGPVPARITYSFKDDQFTHALITFKPDDYPTLRKIFIERYGKPTTETDEPYQTKGGVKTTNPIARWIGQRIWIEIRGYGGKITEGRASLILKEEIDKGVREREQAIQKGKGDL